MKWFYIAYFIIGFALFSWALIDAPIWVARGFCGLTVMCSAVAHTILDIKEKK